MFSNLNLLRAGAIKHFLLIGGFIPLVRSTPVVRRIEARAFEYHSGACPYKTLYLAPTSRIKALLELLVAHGLKDFKCVPAITATVIVVRH